MKTHKLHLALMMLGFFFSTHLASAQSYTYKGMYVYSLDAILNDASGKTEDVLLRYCRDSSINALTLSVGAYNLNTTPSFATKLASFMKKARTRYGVKYFSAVFSDYPTLVNEIRFYQKSRTDSLEKFSYYNYEFEYWNNNFYTASGSSETAYCTKYLQPEGYSCDSVGAWNYFKKYIKRVDSLAHVDNIKSSLYIGVKSKDTLKNRFIANTVDLIMIASYKNVPADLYQTHTTGKFTAFAKASRKVNVVPIFASLSQSANENLKQWLKVPPSGKHAESSAMPYFVSEYNLLPANVRNNLNLIGYQWFKYGGMPKDSSFTAISITPVGLSANVAATSATISWTAVSGASDYSIWYAPANTYQWSKASSNTASIALSGLASNITYNCLVFAKTANGSTASSTILTFTTGTGTSTCNKTNGLSAASITNSTATLSWSAVAGSASYNVRYKPTSATTWSTVSTATNAITLNTLTAATTYEFQVETKCSATITSDFTTSANFTTAQNLCGIPSALAASAITSTSTTLSWAAVSGATGYNLSYRLGSSGTWINQTTSQTSINLNALIPASSYEFQVQSQCSATTQSSYSSLSNFSTANPVCVVPAGLTTSAITATSASINWSTVTYASSYLLQYRVKGTSIWTSVSVTGTSTSLNNLLPSSTYEIAVKSVCSVTSSSAFSANSEFITNSNCAAPASNNATVNSSTGATINWAASTNALSYKVEYKLSSASTWTSVSASGLSQTINTLSPASVYNYRIQTVCSNSSSNYTNTAQFTTQDNSVTCAIPTGLFVNSIASTAVTLNWIPVSGVSNYKVQYRILGTSVWTSKTTAHIYKRISSLKSNTTYEYKVQSTCSSTLSSAYSITATFKTSSTAARTISSGSAQRTANGITIKWTADEATDVDYYTIEKSEDGDEFEPFRQVNAEEAFGVATAYEINDMDFTVNANNTTIWYKLSEVDTDGNITYLRTIEVSPKSNFEDEFKIYPNPNPGDNINVEIQLENQAKMLVVLMDILGNTIYSKVVITDESGFATSVINPSQELPKGIYQVVGYSSTKTLSQKLIVK